MRFSGSRCDAFLKVGAVAIVFAGLVSCSPAGNAQGLAAGEIAGHAVASNEAVLLSAVSPIEADLLPDAPGEPSAAPAGNLSAPDAISDASTSSTSVAGAASFDREPLLAHHPVAPLYEKYIEPGQTTLTLTGRDKVIFGFRQEATIYFPVGAVFSSGYSHLTNGSPNYGTNADAYAQRFGAALARNASQNIFSDSLFALILHEDPRYYVMGNRRNGFVRAGYAVSRVLLTRSEAGDTTPNFSLLGGYASAAGLTNAYYPPTNRGFTETAKTFGTSLGGAAFSNVVREFLPDLLHVVHFE